MEILHIPIHFDYTLMIVGIGAALLGTVSGALGSYAVLRRQSLLGDAISHAALPGIAIAFLLTGSKMPLVMVLGAAIVGWLGTLLILSIVRLTRIKYDSALAIVLSTFFGFGLVLHTLIQRTGNANQAGLDTFLFGQAATMLARDALTIGILGGVAIIIMLIFWKELKLLVFDEGFAASIGFPIRALDILLTSLLVIAIVLGLQAVGAVLMSAMLVAPAVAAETVDESIKPDDFPRSVLWCIRRRERNYYQQHRGSYPDRSHDCAVCNSSGGNLNRFCPKSWTFMGFAAPATKQTQPKGDNESVVVTTTAEDK